MEDSLLYVERERGGYLVWVSWGARMRAECPEATACRHAWHLRRESLRRVWGYLAQAQAVDPHTRLRDLTGDVPPQERPPLVLYAGTTERQGRLPGI